jgi:hypothetical protein
MMYLVDILFMILYFSVDIYFDVWYGTSFMHKQVQGSS